MNPEESKGSGGRSRRNCRARCYNEDFGLSDENMLFLAAGSCWSEIESAPRFSSVLSVEDLGYRPKSPRKKNSNIIESSSDDDELGDS